MVRGACTRAIQRSPFFFYFSFFFLSLFFAEKRRGKKRKGGIPPTLFFPPFQTCESPPPPARSFEASALGFTATTGNIGRCCLPYTAKPSSEAPA